MLAQAAPAWWVASLAIMAGSVWPMAWRWQRLLAARGVQDSLRWLVRSYFVGYAAGQILPTSLGGDASRIYETSRRHEGTGGAAAGTVLLERAAAIDGVRGIRVYRKPGYIFRDLRRASDRAGAILATGDTRAEALAAADEAAARIDFVTAAVEALA